MRSFTDDAVAEKMNAANPKYVPREWVLKEAYTAADRGDTTGVHALLELFRKPYDEQPEMERFAHPAPLHAETVGGVGFMS